MWVSWAHAQDNTRGNMQEKLPSLYVIGREFDALAEIIDGADGEVTEADAGALEGWLASLQGTLASKVEAVCAWRAETLARAEARAKEAKRLAALAKRDAKHVDRIDALMLVTLQQAGLTKVESDRFVVSVDENGGKEPIVLDDDWEALLPAGYIKYSAAADKDALYTSLKQGWDIPGAKLGTKGTHLKVR